MAFVSITEAIRLSGVSRATFYKKYLKEGKISTSGDAKGRKRIDTAELIRVFGKLAGDDQTIQVDNTKNDQEYSIRQKYTALEQQVRQLEKELKQAISRGEELQKDKEALREDNKWHQSEISKLTDTVKLLEDKREEKKPSRRWWRWWS